MSYIYDPYTDKFINKEYNENNFPLSFNKTVSPYPYNEDSRLRTIYEKGYKKGFEDAKKFYSPTTK